MKKYLTALTLLFAFCAQLWSQANTLATVTGRVTDENNEVVPGATVTVTNESTGFSTGTLTSVDGEYTLRQIPLGSPYTIRVSFVGYGDQVRSNYTLNQGDVLRADFQLSESTVVIEEVQVVANSMKKKAANIGSATSVSVPRSCTGTASIGLLDPLKLPRPYCVCDSATTTLVSQKLCGSDVYG